MYKMTITYEDFDGDQQTDDFYFNLTMQEVTALENSVNGGISRLLDKIIKANDQPKVMEYFKKMLDMAYGVKKDGRFIKNPQVLEEFTSSGAYSEIYMKLATDADAASEFVNGIMPKGMEEKLKSQNTPALKTV